MSPVRYQRSPSRSTKADAVRASSSRYPSASIGPARCSSPSTSAVRTVPNGTPSYTHPPLVSLAPYVVTIRTPASSARCRSGAGVACPPTRTASNRASARVASRVVEDACELHRHQGGVATGRGRTGDEPFGRLGERGGREVPGWHDDGVGARGDRAGQDVDARDVVRRQCEHPAPGPTECRVRRGGTGEERLGRERHALAGAGGPARLDHQGDRLTDLGRRWRRQCRSPLGDGEQCGAAGECCLQAAQHGRRVRRAGRDQRTGHQ